MLQVYLSVQVGKQAFRLPFPPFICLFSQHPHVSQSHTLSEQPCESGSGRRNRLCKVRQCSSSLLLHDKSPLNLVFETTAILSCFLWVRHGGRAQLSGSSSESLMQLVRQCLELEQSGWRRCGPAGDLSIVVSPHGHKALPAAPLRATLGFLTA